MVGKEGLIAFESKMAKLYEDGEIKAPIHLAGGNEDELINLFKHIKKGDWIFSTWRNHYHWLLSGRDPDELERQIVDGHSMHVFDDKFFTSAIVGGIPSIAVGVAWALKKKRSKHQVFCFVGCMGSRCGITMESINYATGHDLPIMFVIEDNDLSVRTCTSESWGKCKMNRTLSYKYKRKYPHAGTGVFVLF